MGLTIKGLSFEKCNKFIVTSISKGNCLFLHLMKKDSIEFPLNLPTDLQQLILTF